MLDSQRIQLVVTLASIVADCDFEHHGDGAMLSQKLKNRPKIFGVAVTSCRFSAKPACSHLLSSVFYRPVCNAAAFPPPDP
jgi:hypothetical protein